MSRIIARTACIGLLIVGFGMAAVSGTARADEWADSLFSEHGVDFGPVPRGAKVRQNFILTNRLNEALTILDVRAVLRLHLGSRQRLGGRGGRNRRH